MPQKIQHENKLPLAERIAMRLLCGWLAASLAGIATTAAPFYTLEFVTQVNLPLFIIIMPAVAAALFLLDRFNNRFPVDAAALAGTALCYAIAVVAARLNLFFTIGVLLALCFIGYYLLRDDKLRLAKVTLTRRWTIALTIAGGAFFVLFVGGLTTLRYLNYNTTTYDFGIFAQMFYYMRETGLPMTTCERNELLSHFAVHLSPAFYLLLPGYMIFPSPIYLQIAQAVVVATGLVPLYLLCRHFGLGNKATLGVCLAYSFFPALAGSCFYDIHENLFLAPLLLWVLYCMEKQRWMWMYICAALTFMVKEDAPLYIACIALFLFFTRKRKEGKLHGVILFASSILYFLMAMVILTTFGEGASALNTRLGNFMPGTDGGLAGILKTAFLNPAYVISEIFQNTAENNREKFNYMLFMLVPLAGLPLAGRKLSGLLLVIPFVVINLMSNYQYMYNITFQYHFGTSALLLYLTAANLAPIKTGVRKYIVPYIVTASLLLFITGLYGYTHNVRTHIDRSPDFRRMDSILETIPQEACVQASPFLVPKLSARRVIYDIRYNHRDPEPQTTEYIALDLRPGRNAESLEFLRKFEAKGFVRTQYAADLAVVLRDETWGK